MDAEINSVCVESCTTTKSGVRAKDVGMKTTHTKRTEEVKPKAPKRHAIVRRWRSGWAGTLPMSGKYVTSETETNDKKKTHTNMTKCRRRCASSFRNHVTIYFIHFSRVAHVRLYILPLFRLLPSPHSYDSFFSFSFASHSIRFLTFYHFLHHVIIM